MADPPDAPRLLRSLRVLLVEDNAVNRLIATRLLEKLGHQVVTAENGRIAVEVVQREPFDVVLMDVQMPEMDGIEATRTIRRWERFAGGRVPIVALTAHAMRGDEVRCLECGMDGYLTKPIDRKQLQEHLARSLPVRNDTAAQTAGAPDRGSRAQPKVV
jgi:CheY-like chemotaxis protein